MTTRIHIVNFGPERVVAQTINPKTSEPNPTAPVELGAQQSTDLYVYDSQSVIVQEKP